MRETRERLRKRAEKSMMFQSIPQLSLQGTPSFKLTLDQMAQISNAESNFGTLDPALFDSLVRA